MFAAVWIPGEQQDAAGCGKNEENSYQRFLLFWPTLLRPVEPDSCD